VLSKEKHTEFIKATSSNFGFDFCGIAKAEMLNDDARRLENWLRQGMHGNTHYMDNHFDLRIDPTKLVPGARSVITLLKNYYPSKEINNDLKISKYAYGHDYHKVIKKHLKGFIHELQSKIGQFQGRGFVDSAPVLERTWATKSGLGWIGKNGNLITRQSGSFFFIATLITDLELIYDQPFAKDYCGSCKRCIESCPTYAILTNKTINGSKCISYFTIELRDETIPSGYEDKFKNWMFGCDICQDVCPWNRFSKKHDETEFNPIPELLNLTTAEWENLNEEAFKRIFGKSPLSRAKLKGIQRNIRYILGD